MSKSSVKNTHKRKSSRSRQTPGFGARKRALTLVSRVLDEGEPLEYLLDRDDKDKMPANDRALARAIASTTLRRKGQIDKVLAGLMQKPLGKRGGAAMHILRITAAQILFMDVPDHASVSIAMDIAKGDHKARHFSKLINGVLRTLAREKDVLMSGLKPRDILPDWLCESWTDAYGADTCSQMAEALSCEPYLDISVKTQADIHAEALNGKLLPNGTIRLRSRGLVSDLAGFQEGAWWVQDVAASLAPTLLGDVQGKTVADLCAAPGGKSAYLAARGAKVSAIDISAERLQKLDDNLKRLGLNVGIIEADVTEWAPEDHFDCVLLDAPCSATGTARKHPDVLWLKSPELVHRLRDIQRALLKQAVHLLKPGGLLVYCTCSLQPDEGEAILDFVKREKLPLEIVPVVPSQVGDLSEIIRPDGTIRTRPDHRPLGSLSPSINDDPVMKGMDGFFMVRFKKADK